MSLGATRPNRGRIPTSRSKSIPAPSGGWNARDAISDMPETDAVTLENWIPRPDRVELRKGYEQHVTGITGPVDSLMPYVSPTASKLFGAANNAIYDVTSAGAVGAAVVAGLSNNRWQDVMFSTAGGNFLVICNGADAVRNYNGTTWTTPTITGVSSATLIHVNVHKFRLFFIEKDSMSFWYLPLNSIAGAAQEFNLASIFRKGGELVAMGTWTLDSGTGADDLAVFITSEGEVAVYQGTDPSDATRWGLVGVFTTGKPIGRRCFVKIAGDLIMLTDAGFLPVSRSLYTDRTAPQLSLSAKIENAVNRSTQSSSTNFGWQGIYFPTQNLVIFNIPIVENSEIEQYCMDLSTKGWCQFTDIEGNCWAILGTDIYFGGNTVVGKALTGTSDNNTNIVGVVKPAFNYFGTKGRQKKINMLRPVLRLSGKVAISLVVDIDFGDSTPNQQQIFDNPTGSPWDTSPWDSSPWDIGSQLQTIWYNGNGIGYAATSKFEFCTKNATELNMSAIDYLYQLGEFI